MKAALCTRYGAADGVGVQDIPTPIPGDQQILIEVVATPLTTADWRVRSLCMPYGFKFLARLAFGWSKPRNPILGTALSGVVVATGSKVTSFQVGDEVIAATEAKFGCHAEYVRLNETAAVVHKPHQLSHVQAAALSFGASAAHYFLCQKVQVKRGDKVLIYGASGAVGSAAVQLARNAGAEITGVCSGAHADFVRALGAHNVIDYTKDDALRSGQRYDVIFDTVGIVSFAIARQALGAQGRLLLASATLPDMLSALWTNLWRQQKVVCGMATATKASLRSLVELVVGGQFTPAIDSIYPLHDIASAHAHVEHRHKQGTVVITMK